MRIQPMPQLLVCSHLGKEMDHVGVLLLHAVSLSSLRGMLTHKQLSQAAQQLLLSN